MQVVILDFGKALKADSTFFRLQSARYAVENKRRHLDPGYCRPGGEGQHTDNWSYSVVLNAFMPNSDFDTESDVETKKTLKNWIGSVQDPDIEVRKLSKLSDVLQILNSAIKKFLLKLKTSEVERVRSL